MPDALHYLDCTDEDCQGCLPTDDDVRAMTLGRATVDAGRRGLPRVRAVERKAAILADADEYRARARSERVR